MRKLKRSIARRNMLLLGIGNLNRKQADGKSKFAKHWREFLR